MNCISRTMETGCTADLHSQPQMHFLWNQSVIHSCCFFMWYCWLFRAIQCYASAFIVATLFRLCLLDNNCKNTTSGGKKGTKRRKSFFFKVPRCEVIASGSICVVFMVTCFWVSPAKPHSYCCYHRAFCLFLLFLHQTFKPRISIFTSLDHQKFLPKGFMFCLGI